MLKRDVGDNLKEVVAQSCGIRLDTTLKVGNEKGCNYGEQAGLFVQKIHQRRDQGGCGKSTHKDQCGVQVLFGLRTKSQSCSLALRWNLS